MKSQTQFTKPCPSCGEEQFFRNKYFLNRAIKANTRCKKCSRAQSDVWKSRTKAKKDNNNCIRCGVKIVDYTYHNRKYCSNRCRAESTSIKNQTDCKSCKKSFVWFGNKSRKFCSVSCANHWILLNNKTDTFPERKVMEILNSLSIKYTTQYELEGKFYDIKILDSNILIEVDGVYWHGKDKKDDELNEVQSINRINDKLKTKIAKRLGYRLIRVWEGEENFLLEELKKVKL